MSARDAVTSARYTAGLELPAILEAADAILAEFDRRSTTVGEALEHLLAAQISPSIKREQIESLQTKGPRRSPSAAKREPYRGPQNAVGPCW